MYSFVPNTHYKDLKQTPSINSIFLHLQTFKETFQICNYTKRFSIKMYKLEKKKQNNMNKHHLKLPFP